MAIYSLRLIEGERRSSGWHRSRSKLPAYLSMGAASMMFDTHRRLSRIRRRKVGANLEGVGVLVKPSELEAYFLSEPFSNERSATWAAGLDPKKRFFLFTREE